VLNAKTGEQLYYNTFITNHRLSAENVAQVAHAGRGRWKIETDLPLKKALEFPILSNTSTSCMDLACPRCGH